ncbi:MAG: hypothetical protein ACYCOY_02285 [Metallibacterium sp.]
MREQVIRRQLRQEFVARGLASRDEARQTGDYAEAAAAHAELRGMLTKAKAAKGRRR